MAFAAEYAKGEAKRAQRTGELERALAADERFVNAMIEESQGMKSREEAAEAYRTIKKMYWDKLVPHMQNGLIEVQNVLDDELRNVRQDLSRRFQALPDQIAPPPDQDRAAAYSPATNPARETTARQCAGGWARSGIFPRNHRRNTVGQRRDGGP